MSIELQLEFNCQSLFPRAIRQILVVLVVRLVKKKKNPPMFSLFLTIKQLRLLLLLLFKDQRRLKRFERKFYLQKCMLTFFQQQLPKVSPKISPKVAVASASPSDVLAPPVVVQPPAVARPKVAFTLFFDFGCCSNL